MVRNIALVGAVDEDVALLGDDEERAQGFGADVIDVADDFVRREGRGLVFGRAHVAGEDRARREGSSLGGDGGWSGAF
jgi:hypothetical protein